MGSGWTKAAHASGLIETTWPDVTVGLSFLCPLLSRRFLLPSFLRPVLRIDARASLAVPSFCRSAQPHSSAGLIRRCCCQLFASSFMYVQIWTLLFVLNWTHNSKYLFLACLILSSSFCLFFHLLWGDRKIYLAFLFRSNSPNLSIHP